MERKGDWAQIYSGKKFWTLDPRPEEVDIDDIAHSLALQCRFNGHTTAFYSIAQHSVLVSRIVNPTQALAALFHDASETYTGDLIAPLKRFLPPVFKEIERKIESAIFQHFGINEEEVDHQEIKRADKIALFTERRDLMKESSAKWGDEDLFKPHSEKIVPLMPDEAKELFLKRFEELTKG